jgi:hypothetical protein
MIVGVGIIGVAVGFTVGNDVGDFVGIITVGLTVVVARGVSVTDKVVVAVISLFSSGICFVLHPVAVIAATNRNATTKIAIFLTF